MTQLQKPFMKKVGKPGRSLPEGSEGLARAVISALTRPPRPLALLRPAARQDSWATAEVQKLGFVGCPERFCRREVKGRLWEAEPQNNPRISCPKLRE